MSRHWYGETRAWASIAKQKREQRKRRRAAHGPYAPRGKTSRLHKAVKLAKEQEERKASLAAAQALGAALFQDKVENGRREFADDLAEVLLKRLTLARSPSACRKS